MRNSVTINLWLIIYLIIHGGLPISVAEFKYAVSLWYLNQHFCTGTIIHSSHVITAGHCALGIQSSELFVYAGFVNLKDSNVKVRSVIKIYTYYAIKKVNIPAENSTYHDHDIAILKLGHDFFWSSVLQPIPLPEKEHWDPCEVCVVPLWNVYATDGICSINSLLMNVRVLSDGQCHKSGPRIYSNQKCIRSLEGKAIAIPGDSGAPMICKNVLSGIIIRGYSGRQGSILLSVYPYLGFISEIINEGKNDVNSGEFPYVVSIWRNNEYICGGTIIDHSQILTAGHCVRGVRKENLRVIAGKTQIFQRDRKIDWLYVNDIKILQHKKQSNYSDKPRGYLRNDIAILKLTISLAWSSKIGRASLPSNIESDSGQYCQLLRWARVHNVKQGVSRKLVWFTGQVFSAKKCNQLGIPLASNQFCAGSPYKFSLSEYDDGGNPLVCNGIIDGILVGALRTPQKLLSSEATFIQVPNLTQ